MQECGDCTLCCKLLEIKEANSTANNWCKHCDPRSGCTIYDSKPEECTTFNCSWKLDDNAHIDMRPDKSKAVFENVDETLVFGTVDSHYRVKMTVLHQISAFIKSGSSVVIQAFKDKPVMYLADGAKSGEVWNRLTEKSRNDRT